MEGALLSPGVVGVWAGQALACEELVGCLALPLRPTHTSVLSHYLVP